MTRAGATQIPCRRLDDVLGKTGASFIKMDIEGAEYDALCGAAEVIRRHHPVLSICLYHRQADVWKIPLLIHSMAENYRLFLRRYSDDCWEQVCYAIPENRLLCDDSGGCRA